MRVTIARRPPHRQKGKIIATATILLIRHAAHDHLGRVLSGRSENLPLSAEGVDQAQALAAFLSRDPPDTLQSSPVQRARETARAVAERCGGEIEPVDALNEIDFGAWTGRSFDDLAGDPAWEQWNSNRSEATTPGGESMKAAQHRVMEHLRQAASRFADARVVMVSHCDVIRAAIAGVLGLSLDHVLRFEVDPASVSRIAIGDWGAKVISVNEATS